MRLSVEEGVTMVESISPWPLISKGAREHPVQTLQHLLRVIPAARIPERDPCRSSPRSAPASGDPMRHRTHHHRTVAAAAALVLLGTGAGSAEDVPAAAKPTAPEWSL
jgi:hypothetical protein